MISWILTLGVGTGAHSIVAVKSVISAAEVLPSVKHLQGPISSSFYPQDFLSDPPYLAHYSSSAAWPYYKKGAKGFLVNHPLIHRLAHERPTDRKCGSSLEVLSSSKEVLGAHASLNIVFGVGSGVVLRF